MINPQIKEISFENYQKYFLDLISVNKTNNKSGSVDTPIFYHTEAGSLVITFSFNPFIIVVKESLEKLRKDYSVVFDDNYKSVKPELIDWINDKYMDKRGIPDL